jgi:hypothetical protein
MGIKTSIGSALFIAVVCIASCKTNRGLVTPNPPVVTDQGDCVAACDNLKTLGCEQAQPIDMGTTCKVDADCLGPDGATDKFQTCSALGTCMVTCANFCVSTENQGVWLDPTCVKKVTACDQVEQCPAPKKPANSCNGPACPLPGHGH